MPVDLIDNFENEYTFIGNDGPALLLPHRLERPATAA